MAVLPVSWGVYYANGREENNVWTGADNVVQVVVYGDARRTHTKDGDIYERRHTLFSEDTDEAEVRGDPDYWVWKDDDDNFGRGYVVPPNVRRKKFTKVRLAENEHLDIFGRDRQRIVDEP